MARRPRNPAPIELTERDCAVLDSLYAFDGLLARRQIARLHFPDRDDSRIKRRMRGLFEHGYVNQPDESERHRVDEWVYWLDVKGYHLVARRAERTATKAEFARAKGFRWDTVPHMLAVNDVRIAFMEAIARRADCALAEWKSQWALNRYRSDRFTYPHSGGMARQATYVADGFCLIRQSTPQREKDRGFAYLLEVDRGSESQSRISEEKLRRGFHYLNSEAYRQRHGLRFGRLLMITTGDRRMEAMRRQAVEMQVARSFFFTTFARLGFAGAGDAWRLEADIPDTLTAPLWLLADSEQPVALISEEA